MDNNSIIPPPKIQNREFAFSFWNTSGMYRHVKLNKISELKNYLKDNIFRHVYLSGAYYQYPNGLSMTQKEWLGMDFLIDIDADHFMTPCKFKHDSWTCRSCGKKGKGPSPEKCKCDSISFDEITWICDECLEASKKEVIKFIDIFLPDYSIPLDSITIHFSGNRGYHIIIDSEDMRSLGQIERREFVDYLTGTGLNLRSNGIKNIGAKISGPTREAFGWGKYIYNGTVKLINNCESGSLDDLNISKINREKIINNKDTILNELKLSDPKIKSVSSIIWKKLIKYVIDNLSLKIDIPVSIDLHRLIRFVNSLHGKTGFQVQAIKIDKLDDFDPFSDAIAFSNNVNIMVKMKKCPEFRIEDKNYGPYDENQKIELPLPAAIYVLCKGIATYIK